MKLCVPSYTSQMVKNAFISFSGHTTFFTGLVVRASDSGSGDPGSILCRVGVLFP